MSEIRNLFTLFFKKKQFRKTLWGAFFPLLLSALLTRGSGLLLRVSYHARLGASGIGQMQLLHSIRALLTLLSCAGVMPTASRLCAEQPENAVRITQKLCLAVLALSISISMVTLLCSRSLARLLLSNPSAASCLRFMTLRLPPAALGAVLQGYFFAQKKPLRPVLAQIAGLTARTSLSLLLLRFSNTANIFSFLTQLECVNAIAEYFSCLFLLPRFAFRIPTAGRKVGAPSFLMLLAAVLPLWLSALLGSLSHTAENLLIPRVLRLSGSGETLAMEQYGMLCGIVLPALMFPSMLFHLCSTLLLPRIAHLNASGNSVKLRQSAHWLLIFCLIIGVGGFLIYLFLTPLLLSALYQSEAAGEFLRLLSPLVLLDLQENACDLILKALGRQRSLFFADLHDTFLRLFGLLLLLPRLGVSGLILTFYSSALLRLLQRLRLLRSALQR